MAKFPDVFLSYTLSERKLVEMLTMALNNLGVTVSDDIAMGSNFLNFIQHQQSACRVLVLFITSRFVQSKFIQMETFPWLEVFNRRRDPRIFPVLLEETKFKSQFANLHYLQWFDARHRKDYDWLGDLARKIAIEVNRPKIFICHTSKDRTRIAPLVKHLEPDIWFDSQYVPEGVNIKIGIKAGISRSSRFIAFITPTFLNRMKTSKYIQMEIKLAQKREKISPGYAFLCEVDASAPSIGIPIISTAELSVMSINQPYVPKSNLFWG